MAVASGGGEKEANVGGHGVCFSILLALAANGPAMHLGRDEAPLLLLTELVPAVWALPT